MISQNWPRHCACYSVDDLAVFDEDEAGDALDAEPHSQITFFVNVDLSDLKEMEADGMVLRTQYDEMPVRVEYRLTDKAKSIIPILLELKKWGEENMD